MGRTMLWTGGITLAALGAVTFLAVEAKSSAPESFAQERPAATAPTTTPKPKPPAAPALPKDSGDGKRVVYSISADRVWLVAADETVTTDFPVVHGAVIPPPGTYKILHRVESATGGDGVPITYVQYFTKSVDSWIAFGAQEPGPSPADAGKRSGGGIRETVENGRRIWEFAPVGTPVVVTP
ncbi:hypothetical protein GCM10020367_29430 [Streptomyces sannanensis]|uniref:L,D-TPase catalytic domain-containing protein n=1 Tax=Streptomyces sannanensis TaxID=285536 RepID=A0ABP6SBN5_9ACTN